MIHAYDKNYLLKAQNNLGSMFDFAVYDLNEKLDSFFQKFLQSDICPRFEQGESTVIAGRSGIELALQVLENESQGKKYRPVANRSSEYWCGWALAYFQWFTNLSFSQINSFIPVTEVLALYSPYHEMDISQFCDKMLELYNARKKCTNLKSLRVDAGLSQSELAELSGIPVRTIQQYEQRQKNINTAKTETVLTLSKVLSVPVESLLEI